MEDNKKKEFFRVVKYALFAASAGIIQIGSFTAFTEIPKLLGGNEWSYWACYLPSLILSVLWNFTFNRKFTFKSANNIPVAMLKTAVYYLIFTPLSAYLGNIAAEAGVNHYIVEIVTMLVNFITEFLYQRFFVFGKSIDTAEKKKDE